MKKFDIESTAGVANAAPTGLQTGFEMIEIARKEQPDVRFRGRLIASADSREEDRDVRKRDRPHWTRLELWELESGAWVAASIGCSDKPGEIDIGDVLTITPDGANAAPGMAVAEAWHGGPKPKEIQVMDFFGWTWLAKRLADKAGWDVVEEIV